MDLCLHVASLPTGMRLWMMMDGWKGGRKKGGVGCGCWLVTVRLYVGLLLGIHRIQPSPLDWATERKRIWKRLRIVHHVNAIHSFCHASLARVDTFSNERD